MPGPTGAALSAGRRVAASPVRDRRSLIVLSTVCAAGMVKLAVQLEITTDAVMFSTLKVRMKFCGLIVCRVTAQVGAGLAVVVKVTGSERGDRLPLGSTATTTAVYVVPGVSGCT